MDAAAALTWPTDMLWYMSGKKVLWYFPGKFVEVYMHNPAFSEGSLINTDMDSTVDSDGQTGIFHMVVLMCMQEPTAIETTPLTVVSTEEELMRLCHLMKTQSEIAVDTEVSGLDDARTGGSEDEIVINDFIGKTKRLILIDAAV